MNRPFRHLAVVLSALILAFSVQVQAQEEADDSSASSTGPEAVSSDAPGSVLTDDIELPLFQQQRPTGPRNVPLETDEPLPGRAFAVDGDVLCPVELPEATPGQRNWSRQERWAWHEICLGNKVDMRRAVTGLDDGLGCHPGEISGQVPETRRLSASFLRLVLTRAPWKEAMARPLVHLSCAVIPDTLDLYNARIAATLRLDSVLFRSGLTIKNANFDHAFELHDAWVEGQFDAIRSSFGEAFRMYGGIVYEDADFRYATSVGPFVISGSRMIRRLRAGGATIGSNFVLTDRAAFESVDIVGLTATESIVLRGIRITNALLANEMTIGRNVLISGSAGVSADFTASRIGGSFEIDMDMSEQLKAERIAVGGHVIASGSGFQEGLLFRHADIAGQFLLRKAQFVGEVNVNSARIRSDLIATDSQLGGLNIRGTEIGGQFVLDGTKLSGPLSGYGIVVGADLMIVDRSTIDESNFANARIGGNLVLRYAQSTGAADWDGVDIRRNLRISGGASMEELVLRRARIGNQVIIEGARVEGRIRASGVSIDGDLSVSEESRLAEIDLTGAWIGGQLSVTQSKISGLLQAPQLQSGGSVILTDGAALGAVSLRNAGIGGEVRLHGATFYDLLDLSHAEISQGLVTDWSDQRPHWRRQGRVSLAHATARVITSRTRSWEQRDGGPVPVDWRGFRFDTLGRSGDPEDRYLGDIDPRLLDDWVGGFRGPLNSGLHDQMAAALDRSGRHEDGRVLRYLKFVRQDASRSQIRDKLPGLLHRWTTGYGLYPLRLIWWALGLVLTAFAWLLVQNRRAEGP